MPAESTTRAEKLAEVERLRKASQRARSIGYAQYERLCPGPAERAHDDADRLATEANRLEREIMEGGKDDR